jgi:hypothetical protein
MPEKIIYNCQACGCYFRSDDGDLIYVGKSKCLDCGELTTTPGSVCDKCGGQTKIVLQLVCPKCKSSHIHNRGSISVLN